MKFAEALMDGKSSEKIVLKTVQKRHKSAFISEGYNKYYDIAIPEIDKTIEVKKDFKSMETGNVVIETEMNNQPSALSTTQADWWVFHTEPTKLYWITPFTIRDMINIEGFKEVVFTGTGDTKSKKAYLIPIEFLKLYSKKIQTIELVL